MDDQTMDYLRERFAAYYEVTSLSKPPDAVAREYAYIPWSSKPKPPMIRHRSQFDMDPFGETITEKAPCHVYYSSALYDDPAAESMDKKGWRGADIVFDLDADHFENVNPATDTLAEMLEICQNETEELIDILITDLGFSDLTVVFSGRRGFHVHVRDPNLRPFEKDERREIVEYVTANGLQGEDIIREDTVDGAFGQKSATQRRYIDINGGLSRRVWLSFLDFVDEQLVKDEDEAIAELREFDGIGKKRAVAALGGLQNLRDQAQTTVGEGDDGGLIAHPAIHTIFKRFVEAHNTEYGVEIDEPVTTDVGRLIRLPGSLHGGSALVTRSIPLDEFEEFNPTVDAVPEIFAESSEIQIETEETQTSIGDEIREFSAGKHWVPEYVGIHLMTSGRAEFLGDIRSRTDKTVTTNE